MKNKKLLIFFIIIAIVFVFLILLKNKLLKIIYPKDYSDAVSNKGAIGLMQLMENTAKEVAIKNDIRINYDNMKAELFKVDNNINIGTRYLKTLLDKYDCVELAIAAYNAGTGKVDDWIKNRNY